MAPSPTAPPSNSDPRADHCAAVGGSPGPPTYASFRFPAATSSAAAPFAHLCPPRSESPVCAQTRRDPADKARLTGPAVGQERWAATRPRRPGRAHHPRYS